MKETPFNPEWVEVLASFLPNVAKSVVVVSIAGDGTILDANTAFRELLRKNENPESRHIEVFLARADGGLLAPDPLGLAATPSNYLLHSSRIPGTKIRGLLLPRDEGACLVGESHLPSELATLDCMTATINALASHNRDHLRKFRETSQALCAEEEHLHRLEVMHQMLFESLAQGVVYQNEAGQIIGANPAAESILGMPLAQLKDPSGKSARWCSLRENGEAFPAEEQPAMVALRTGQPQLGVIAGIHNHVENSLRWVLVDAVPIVLPGMATPIQVFSSISDITRLKMTQTALSKSESNFKSMLQTTMDGVWLTALDGSFLEVNEAACLMLGYSREELLGMKVSHIEALEAPEVTQGRINRLRQEGSALFQSQHRRKNGVRFPVEVSITLLPDSDHIVVYVRDITSRKQTEQGLLETMQRLRLATASANMGVWDWNIQAGSMTWDDRMFELYGVTRAGAQGTMQDWLAGLHPEDRERAVAECEAALKGEATFDTEFRINRPDGTTLWIKADGLVVRDGNGSPLRMTGLNRDITEHRRSEDALHRSEWMLREAQNAGRVGCYVLDINKRTWESSQALDEIFGIDASYPRDFKGWLDLVAPDLREDMSNYFQDIKHNLGYFNHDYRLIRSKDGQERWVSHHGKFEWDSDGNPILMLGTVQDITERKAAEVEIQHLTEELEQRVKDRTAQLEAANQELEAFSYSVSHDLKGPLRGVDGFSQALVEDYQDRLDETGKHYISRIRAGTQRMGQLIDDLLKLSRVGRSELNLAETSVSDLCTQVLDELTTRAPERRLEVSIQPCLSAWADPNLLQVALENLLRNAWKFTSKREGARIEVGETTASSGERVFYIRDNGVGFAMEHVGKLFNAFQRLHSASEFDGTGIGLAIVQRIINRHGGRVWAEAEPSNGATFFFTLPVRGEA